MVRQVKYAMRNLFVMFVTAVCFLFFLKLKWPKNKNVYGVILDLTPVRGEEHLMPRPRNRILVSLRVPTSTPPPPTSPRAFPL